MIRHIITASLRNRLLVFIATGLLVIAGVFAIRNIPLATIMDCANN